MFQRSEYKGEYNDKQVPNLARNSSFNWKALHCLSKDK